MPSDFRIQVGRGGDVYELAVTTDVKVSARNSITSHKTESKEVITDNAVAFNKEISYNGRISTIRRVDQIQADLSGFLTNPLAAAKSFLKEKITEFFGMEIQNYYRSPKDYLEGLDKVREDKELVICFLTNDLNPIPNCLIERLEYTKDQSGGVSCWHVNIVLKEVRLSTKATESTIPSPATADATAGETDNGNASTVEDNSLTTTVGVSGLSGLSRGGGG